MVLRPHLPAWQQWTPEAEVVEEEEAWRLRSGPWTRARLRLSCLSHPLASQVSGGGQGAGGTWMRRRRQMASQEKPFHRSAASPVQRHRAARAALPSARQGPRRPWSTRRRGPRRSAPQPDAGQHSGPGPPGRRKDTRNTPISTPVFPCGEEQESGQSQGTGGASDHCPAALTGEARWEKAEAAPRG